MRQLLKQFFVKHVKDTASRLKGLFLKHLKVIIRILGFLICGGLTFIFMGKLSTIDIGLEIQYRAELMQGILIASTALMGLSGVFVTRDLVSVKQRSLVSLNISLMLGLFCILFVIVWFTNATDIWILLSMLLFFLQLLLFTFSRAYGS